MEEVKRKRVHTKRVPAARIIPTADNYPLRDRIIHQLAVEPATSCMQVLREIEKSGKVSLRDRATFVRMCEEVAIKEKNLFVLDGRFHHELRRDWPFYTNDNRTVLKSLLEKLETSPVGSASNTPDLFPCHSTNSQNPIGSRSKMAGPSIGEVNYTLPASKKRRIAHAQSPSAQQPSTQQLLQQSPQQPAQQPPPRHHQQHPKELPENKVCTKSEPNKNSSVSVPPKVPDAIKSKNKQDNRGNCSTQQPLQQSQQQPAQQPPPPRPLQQHPKELPKMKVCTKSVSNKNSSVSVQAKVPDAIKSENKQDNRGVSNGAAPSAIDESCQENVNNVSVPQSSEDYLRKYVEILTDEQRNIYNDDFNAEYDEYKMLSEKTSERTKIFRDLNAKMKSTDKVDEYEQFKKEIISEYHKLKCDTKYVEQKVRCEHLHVKLAHIKHLVSDYDQRSKSASSS